MSPHSTPSHQIHVYHSALCCDCNAWMSGENKEGEYTPQLVPVNPRVYASYLCTSCFESIPVSEVVRLFRAYLLSENGMLREQRTAWLAGTFALDPLLYLEDAIQFLRGERDVPPFECSVFILHKKSFSKQCRSRRHLTLVSFD